MLLNYILHVIILTYHLKFLTLNIFLFNVKEMNIYPILGAVLGPVLT